MTTSRVLALWGNDHTDLGAVAEADWSYVALALSRGRFPKPVAHVDPNEDGALAVIGGQGSVLAVADGHHGFDVARAALRTIADRAAAMLAEPVASPSRALGALIDTAATAALEAVRHETGVRRTSRASLSVALVTLGRVHAVTLGDTAIVRVRRAKAKVLSRPSDFLGPHVASPRPMSVRVRVGDRLVVVSDGITDFLGRRWPAVLAELVSGQPPSPAARSLVLSAMDCGAGDHLAVAVLEVI